jgi:hypothetical protein
LKVAQRLFGCIVCESNSNPYYRDLVLSGQDSAALVSQLLSALNNPEAEIDLNSPENCCGGRADVEDGTFLGGYFRDGSSIEAFRAVVDQKCARYFGQCQVHAKPMMLMRRGSMAAGVDGSMDLDDGAMKPSLGFRIN